MTTAALMKAEARAEGEKKGESRGRLLGGIAMLESILNLPATPQEMLESMTQSELEAVVQTLQTKYRERVPESK